MDKINKKAFEPIDEEERGLMESIENDEWRSVGRPARRFPCLAQGTL